MRKGHPGGVLRHQPRGHPGADHRGHRGRAGGSLFRSRAFRRAFTSGMISPEAEGGTPGHPSAAEALEDLLREGCTDVVIQPTHVINGEEYDKLLAQAEPCRGRFARLSVGAPLLTTVEDYHAPGGGGAGRAAGGAGGYGNIFMGHGTEHYVNPSYAQLGTSFTTWGAGTSSSAPWRATRRWSRCSGAWGSGRR